MLLDGFRLRVPTYRPGLMRQQRAARRRKPHNAPSVLHDLFMVGAWIVANHRTVREWLTPDACEVVPPEAGECRAAITMDRNVEDLLFLTPQTGQHEQLIALIRLEPVRQ